MRILIVDDEPTVAEALAEAVRRQGHEALVTHQGAESLLAIRDDPPDGVFLDLIMPGMSGVEVLRRIRDERPGLPVVLVTGYPNVDDIDEARRLGIADVIEKPMILRNLADALERLRSE